MRAKFGEVLTEKTSNHIILCEKTAVLGALLERLPDYTSHIARKISN